jgi:Ca2+/Na+ antiporter
MLPNLSYLAPSLFAFYLIVACNYVPEIYGCKLQTLLRTNMIAKHITGILLLFFLVIYVKPDNVDREIFYNIGLTLLIYIWFLITSRSPLIVIVFTIILLIVIYIYDIRKTRLSEEKDKNKKEIDDIDTIQKILSVILVLIGVVGFIYYYGQKKMEYKDKFDIYKFIIGTTQCRNSNNYPINVKNR